MIDIFKLAADNQELARQIIGELKIVEHWQTAGAKINLVGSLATGLLMKHRDIDFHAYTPELNVAESFDIIGQIAAHPKIKKVSFANLSEAADCCLEWHLEYEDQNKHVWIIDIIQIKEGSLYDGYFEKVAARINETATPEQRATILRLKYQTPDEIKIPGILYYQAVIRDGVSTYAEFKKWHKENQTNGIIEWLP